MKTAPLLNSPSKMMMPSIYAEVSFIYSFPTNTRVLMPSKKARTPLPLQSMDVMSQMPLLYPEHSKISNKWARDLKRPNMIGQNNALSLHAASMRNCLRFWLTAVSLINEKDQSRIFISSIDNSRHRNIVSDFKSQISRKDSLKFHLEIINLPGTIRLHPFSPQTLEPLLLLISMVLVEIQ